MIIFRKLCCLRENNKKNIKIITSENNKELEKRLKELSQELIVENYELYKELENC